MRHRQAIALLALIGLLVSIYLSLHRLGVIGTLQCGTGGCETVQSSDYAAFLGVPVAFIGAAGYLVLLIVSLVSLQPAYLHRRGPTLVLAAIAVPGFLFTLYLKYLELFVIHAICRWCVVSAVIITAITVVAVAAAVRRPGPQASSASY
jgi:uncharacterized membrane protein